MAKASYETREIKFIFEPELTQCYVYLEAHGDCPLGVQGVHHKTFPASMSALDILTNETINAVTWPLNAWD